MFYGLDKLLVDIAKQYSDTMQSDTKVPTKEHLDSEVTIPLRTAIVAQRAVKLLRDSLDQEIRRIEKGRFRGDPALSTGAAIQRTDVNEKVVEMLRNNCLGSLDRAVKKGLSSSKKDRT